jgi:iron complex outermembrane receptor protein
MRTSSIAALLLGTGLAMLAVPSAAAEPDHAVAAADPDQKGDDIIVNGERVKKSGSTGTKTETPLLLTPQAITSIDEEELRRRNALSINQALGYVAGVAPNQRGAVATRYDQLFVRGFTPGQYMDGMRLLGGIYATPQIDFHLVERVDVIKGPASVLYGNSTPGGLINLTSKVPQPGASGRIELAAGNYALLRSAIDVNQPLDRNDTWLFRVIAGAEQSDGFIARTGNRRYYARPMLTFAPDEATSITLILNYQRDPEAASYSGVPVYGSALPNPFGRFPTDLNVSEPAYEAFDRTQKSATLLFRHRFNDALSWTSNARFLDIDLHYRQIYLSAFATTGTGANRATDFSTIVRGGGGADEAFRTITLDNHLAATFSTGPLAHTLLAGIDWQSNRGRNDQQFNLGVTSNPVTSIPNLNLFAPVYGGVQPSFPLTATRSFRKIEQVGLYAQDQVALGRLQLIASGRWDWYEQTTRNRNLAEGNATAVARLHQTAFTGRLGALYETGFGLAPFVSYSESFEPQSGTTTILAPGTTTAIAGPAFVPVTGRQYEGGVKYQPRGTTALVTLSAFDLRRQNVPATDPRAGQGGIPTSAQVQIGEVAVRGIELDGRGDLAPGLSATIAGSYTHARVTQGTPVVGTGDQLSGVTGTRPLGVPTWSASSFVSYDLGRAAAEPLGGLTLGGGVRYVGESDGTAQVVSAGQTVTTRFRSPGYVLADAVIGYDLGRLSDTLHGLSLTGNVANLFDKRHIASCFFNNSCYFGASRTWVATLRATW